MGRRSQINEVSKDDLQAVIDESKSYREVLHTLGYVSSAGGYRTLYKRIARDNLDVTALKENNKQWQQKTWNTVPEEEFFAKDSLYFRARIKRRILRDNSIPYECSKCGNVGIWNNKRLVLEIEHINGVNNDHRLENLTFLCLNCHSQTDTYSGKNAKNVKPEKPENTCQGCEKIISKASTFCTTCMGSNNRRTSRPSREQLYKDLVEFNYVGTGKKYGVSDNTIRKWCDSLDLPRRARELKTFVL